MKGLAPLFLGIIGTFFFSWAGLALVPNFQIGHLEPQADEEGTDIYPLPRSGMAERGRRIYAANGCVYCHTQQVRADYAASDMERKWGDRRSAPRDYVFDRPAFLGKIRMGPDLANVGKRAPVTDANAPEPAAASTTQSAAASAAGGPSGTPAPAAGAGASSPPPGSQPPPSQSAPPAAGAAPAPSAVAAAPAPAPPNPSPAAPSAPQAGPASPTSTNAAVTAASPSDNQPSPSGSPVPYSAAWHHKHLYSPRSINIDSTMPSYAFLYEKRRLEGEYSSDALKLSGNDAPAPGWQIVPTYDAKCLVAYLMSLDQTHALKEVKSVAGPASPPAPAKKSP